MQKIDLNILDKYLHEHLIVKQKHPIFDIWIYNYTPECVFSRKWDEVTTMCRGLILDKEGNIVALPFKKFFNYGEVTTSLPKGVPKIFKKLDGSLLITTKYKDELIVATRGSFVSDQAKLAKMLIVQNKELRKVIMSGDNQFTYLLEVTGPGNRIVVSYPENKLTLLAVITNWNGKEHNLDFYRNNHKFDIVEEFKAEWDSNTIEYLKNLNISNEEGFVLKWENGFRCKIKFESYLYLHRLVTGLNEKTIWEWMKEGKDINELVKNVPEEFKKWVMNIFYNIDSEKNSIIDGVIHFLYKNDLFFKERKEAALLIMKEIPKYQAIAFEMLDKREEKAIWKFIKPLNNEVFKDRSEEI
jgi:RNA ligase